MWKKMTNSRLVFRGYLIPVESDTNLLERFYELNGKIFFPTRLTETRIYGYVEGELEVERYKNRSPDIKYLQNVRTMSTCIGYKDGKTWSVFRYEGAPVERISISDEYSDVPTSSPLYGRMHGSYDFPHCPEVDFVKFLNAFSLSVCPFCGALSKNGPGTCYICTALVSGIKKCSDCGKTIYEEQQVYTNSDGKYVCSVCAPRHKGKCSECGCLIELGPEKICKRCRMSFCTCQKCGKTDRKSQFIIHKAYVECKDCARSSVLVRDYHSNTSRSMPTFYGANGESEALFLGFELEVARKNDVTYRDFAIRQLKNIFETKYLEFTRDGSLTDGIEIISQPATIEHHRSLRTKYSEAFEALLASKLYGHDCREAGLHVHVSKKAFNSLGVEVYPGWTIAYGRLLLLFARFENILNVLSRRGNNRSYCQKIIPEWGLPPTDDPNYASKFALLRETSESGHYTELNTESSQTIEFRLFRSTLNLESFFAILEFVNGVGKYVLSHTFNDCRVVTFEELLAFIDSNDLRNYVTRLGADKLSASEVGIEQEEQIIAVKREVAEATYTLTS